MRNRGNFQIDGDIKCNGTIMKSYEDISSVSGYVQQDDLFIGKSDFKVNLLMFILKYDTFLKGYLTVREHLIFQAMLRMKIGTPEEERIRRVDEILNDVKTKVNFLLNLIQLRY